MIARPPRRRAVVRQPQPETSVLDQSNPLQTEPAWSTEGELTATVQAWSDGSWHDLQQVFAPTLDDLMRTLNDVMLDQQPFVTHVEGWPQRPSSAVLLPTIWCSGPSRFASNTYRT